MLHNNQHSSPQTVTAAVIVIGDEILSGKTTDSNLAYLAKQLSNLNIDLKQAHIIGDSTQDIITTLNQCRCQYNYVFTTGGIGPTHDDITTDAISQALNVKLVHNKIAAQAIQNNCTSEQINQAQLKMAQIPLDAKLIPNSISGAPGWNIDNVYVLAGVPHIMRAMFTNLIPLLTSGPKLFTTTVNVLAGESKIAQYLNQLAAQFEQVKIGSYPKYTQDHSEYVEIVMSGQKQNLVEEAITNLKQYLRAQKIEFN